MIFLMNSGFKNFAVSGTLKLFKKSLRLMLSSELPPMNCFIIIDSAACILLLIFLEYAKTAPSEVFMFSLMMYIIGRFSAQILVICLTKSSISAFFSHFALVLSWISNNSFALSIAEP